jgi:hypothetical protein
MPRVELKLKQASAVLGVPPKDLQNFVQARVLKPRRRLGLYYFDTNLLLQATVALYLKGSLGASTRYLTKFAEAVARLPGFETNTPAIVRVRASAWKNEPPVEIRIPLGALARELRRRLPLADVAKDLPRGRKRVGWKRAFLASVREAATELTGVSDEQIADTVNAYRRDRVKSGLTVVAEAASQTA